MKEFSINQSQPFNSPFETGLRSACLLSVDLSISLDLQQLSAFDHLVVHTGDFEDAPESLHPDTPHRNGELIVRRELVERGLRLMESRRMISKAPTSAGFVYSVTELASVVLDTLTAHYLLELRQRAKWVIEHYRTFGDRAFPVVFNKAFDRWASEFQFQNISISQNDR